MKFVFKIGIVALFIMLLLAGIAISLISIISSHPSGATGASQSAGPLKLTASASQAEIFDYNNSQSPLAYSLINYNTSGALNATATMSIYFRNPIPQIYLLNVTGYCRSCFDENLLRSDLNNQLIHYDLLGSSKSLNYIAPSYLGSIPMNSLLIVPSGLMPVFFFNGTDPMLLTLLHNGDTIVYVGLNFSKSSGQNGLIYVNNQSLLLDLRYAGLETILINNTLAMPLPSAKQNLSVRYPTFEFRNGFNYGNVTYTYNTSLNGVLIAFPNYPLSSWGSANSMAEDIANVINARVGNPLLGSTNVTMSLASRKIGEIGVFAPIGRLAYNSTPPFALANVSYSLATFTANNQSSSAVREFSFSNSNDKLKGNLSILSFIGETQEVPITMQLSNENTSLRLAHLDLYDRNMSYAGLSVPIGAIAGSRAVVKYHAFSQQGGYYILSLRDINNNYYGSTLFYLAGLNITPLTPYSINFQNGTFAFNLTSNHLEVTNATYTVSLNGAYESSGQVSSGVVRYALPKGTVISQGTQNFNFYMFNSNYTYTTKYQQLVLNVPAIYIEFAVAILVVVLLNLLLKPPNRDEYYIDVPDFPPSRREKVKVPKSAVLGVFDKVNYYHRWKYMPLTEDEIKLGIGNNVRVNNMPVSITMQNTDSLLAELTEEKQLDGISDYYAPNAWIEASGHSVEYLVIFRKLRDYCVSHAILFTDIDSSNVADMLVTREGKQMSVFIYTSTSPMRKITLSRDAKIALVFLNDNAIHNFQAKLYTSFGKEAEVLKLGIEYNYIKLVDSDHLDQLTV